MARPLLVHWLRSLAPSTFCCVGILLATIIFRDQSQAQESLRLHKQPSFLSDTGQTVRYTQTFGEDADFTGVLPSFLDHGDGTITDHVTGLMWQKNDGGSTTWEMAQSYASSLELGGYKDWRLPSSIELFSIMDHGRHGPAMNTDYFPRSDARYWWTCATRADNASRIWVVNTGGGIGAHAKSEAIAAGGDRPMHVRCVRGASPLSPTPRFRDLGDGTVVDDATCLVWQKQNTSERLNWEDALSYCSGLNLAGQSRWRLPNIKELRSLSSDLKTHPSIDTSFFPNAQPKLYWSSTTQSNRSEQAWHVDFENGLVSYSDKSDLNFVIAVTDTFSHAADRNKPAPQTPAKNLGGSTPTPKGSKTKGKK